MGANQAFVFTGASIYILWNVIQPPAGTTVVQSAIRMLALLGITILVEAFGRGVTYLLQLHNIVCFFLGMTCMITTIMFWTSRVEPWLGWSRILPDDPDPKEEAGDCTVS